MLRHAPCRPAAHRGRQADARPVEYQVLDHPQGKGSSRVKPRHRPPPLPVQSTPPATAQAAPLASALHATCHSAGRPPC